MATASLGSLVTYLVGDNTSLNRAIAGSNKKMQQFSNAMKFTGLATGFVMARSVNAFGKFEKAMRNVNTIARQSEGQFKVTSNAVLNLSSELGKMPTDLADALYNINSAGFTASRGLTILKTSAQAAIAGVSDVPVAAKAITSVLNAYNMSIDKAADVSDILFKTVEKGVITFPELAESMGAVLAAGASAGIRFDEIAAAAATMTLKGNDAHKTFTSLNMMLMKFIKPSAQITSLFKQQGYASAIAGVQALGLKGSIELLRKTTGGAADKIARLGFNVRDIKAVFALAGGSGNLFAESLNDIANKKNRAGATLNALKEQQKTLTFQTDRLKASWDGLKISLGQIIAKESGLNGFFANIADSFRGMVKGLNDHSLEISVTLQRLFGGTKAYAQDAFNYFKTYFGEPVGTMLGNIIHNFEELGRAIARGLSNSKKSLNEIGEDVGNAIVNLFGNSFQQVGKLAINSVKDLGANIKNISKAMEDVYSGKGFNFDFTANNIKDGLASGKKDAAAISKEFRSVAKDLGLINASFVNVTKSVNSSKEQARQFTNYLRVSENKRMQSIKDMWKQAEAGLNQPASTYKRRVPQAQIQPQGLMSIDRGDGITDIFKANKNGFEQTGLKLDNNKIEENTKDTADFAEAQLRAQKISNQLLQSILYKPSNLAEATL